MIHVSTSKIPLRDETGTIFGLPGIHEDITERKQSTIALQRAVDDLRRSNSELEQLAYVASHDLQEP